MTLRSATVLRTALLVLALGLCAWLGARYWPHRAAPVTAQRDSASVRRLPDAQHGPPDIAHLRVQAVAAPRDARVQAMLARALVETLPPAPMPASVLDDARRQVALSLALGAQLADVQFAQAILACREAAWARCMDAFARALQANPADVDGRIAYAYWLAAVGHIGAAAHEAQTARDADPRSSAAAFALARTLDTVGRHNNALLVLDAVTTPTAGLIYAKWYNAIWRRDWATARRLAAGMPEEAGYRESYLAATEASIDPALWPQALPLLRTSERANRHANALRVLMPASDQALNLDALESMLRNGWPSYYMLLWMHEYRGLRQGPAFQDFLKRTGLLAYWSDQGWPMLCKPVGEIARCD